jgi:hypothetical protein
VDLTVNTERVFPLILTMLLPASLILNPNIVIVIRQPISTPFFPDRVSELGIPKMLSIFGRCEAGAALVRGSRVPEVSAALRAADPWDRIPAMSVELKLPAAAFPIGKAKTTKPSPSIPGRQKLTCFERIARFDLLDFHRFLLKETGLQGGLGFFRRNRKDQSGCS